MGEWHKVKVIIFLLLFSIDRACETQIFYLDIFGALDFFFFTI